MVSEPLVDDVSQRRTESAGNGLEFEIVDETSPEQVAKEQQLLAPVEQEESATESLAREKPQPENGEEPRAAQKQDSEIRQESPGEPQPPRTFTQNEVSKMQAAWSRQIEEARQDSEKASAQLQRFNVDAAVEAMLKKQEAELTTSVGADRAGQLVRSPHNAALVRKSIATQQLLTRSESDRRQAVEQQERQAQFVVAQALARAHGVPSEDFELLAAASTPKAMQSLARRLGGEGTAAMRDRVPPETPQTQLENGYNAGPAPESPDRRLERIRAKPSWEWTEADLRYMKTGEVR